MTCQKRMRAVDGKQEIYLEWPKLILCSLYSLDQYIPRLQVISEDYLPDNVTVTVAWTQNTGAMYDIGIVPLAIAPIVSTGNVNSQLIVVYNNEYNLSVVAFTPCGNTTAFITLHYGKALYSIPCDTQ